MKLFNPLKDAMESETLEAAALFNFGIKKINQSLISWNFPVLLVQTHALRMHLLDFLKFL